MMIKSEIRKQLKLIRSSIDNEKVKEKSQRIIEKIISSDEYKNAKYIAVFYPLDKEVDLLDILIDRNKVFLFPRLIDKRDSTMEFAEVGKGFQKASFNLNEPTGKSVNNERIDLIIVPGLGFAYNGHRVGYGKGYYDNYLKDFSGYTIGVCFKEALIDDVFHTQKDIAVKKIITDGETICIKL